MKTTLIAAGTTALLLIFLSSGIANVGLHVPSGLAVLIAFLVFFMIGRLLARARVHRSRTALSASGPVEASRHPAVMTGDAVDVPEVLCAPGPALPTPAIDTEGKALIDIGGQPYLIEADAAYLAHIQPAFEPNMVKLFRLLGAGSRTVLDVGANVGCTALLFARFAKRVHAFEPSRETFALLTKNLDAAGESRNVSLHCFALGSRAETLELVSSPSFRAGAFVGSLSEVSVGHVAEQITVKTLDEISAALHLEDVDFVKIDTEGFDGEVIRGGVRLLRANRPVVVMELNHWSLNVARRQSVPDYLDHLRSVFPVLFALSEDGRTYLDLHDKNQSYVAMYRHILERNYNNLLAAFDRERLQPFLAAYQCAAD